MEGGLVMPVTVRVRVWAGMLDEEELRAVKVMELSIELYVQVGETFNKVPVRAAQVEVIVIESTVGNMTLICPAEVMGSLVVREKV